MSLVKRYIIPSEGLYAKSLGLSTKNRSGWWVDSYDSRGKRCSKMLPDKALADRFARRLEFQFNEDIFFEPVVTLWDDLVAEYLEHK